MLKKDTSSNRNPLVNFDITGNACVDETLDYEQLQLIERGLCENVSAVWHTKDGISIFA